MTWSSKHGATTEIAAAVARGLQESAAGRADGLVVTSVPVDQRPDPARFDAVVLGSAVYLGRWRAEARQYATEHTAALLGRPVWLFSSGPVGDPALPAEASPDAERVTRLVGAREHRLFPGRLDRSLLTFGERVLMTAMRAPTGDFRNWGAVAEWAEGIAAAVSPERTGHRADGHP